MRKKSDMYIDYQRSYKRLRRKNTKRIGIIAVILLAVAIGIVTYFGARHQMNSADNGGLSSGEITGSDMASPTPAQPVTPSVKPVITQPPVKPTISPTVLPTPTPAVNPDDNGFNNEPDTRIPVKVKGIYVTAPSAGTDHINDLVTLADNSEINAMIIDIKDDHGKISYAMENTMAAQIGAVTSTITDLPALINTLKSKNIYLIARIVAFKDPFLAEKRQELAVRNQDGTIYRDSNGEGWVNPYNRQVWDYLAEIASNAAAIGFNEIQFDYIRFSTGQGITEADFGEEAKTVSKEEIITEFTKYIYEKLKPLGVFVSADVYGTIISSSVDAALVGQNYTEMSKYLDYICPMIYPSHFGEGNYGIQYPDKEPYEIIHKVLNASKKDLDQIPEGEHRAIVRPWLQAFTATWVAHHMKYGGDEIRAQVDGVYSVGYDEWILWNAASNYSQDGLLKE